MVDLPKQQEDLGFGMSIVVQDLHDSASEPLLVEVDPEEQAVPTTSPTGTQASWNSGEEGTEDEEQDAERRRCSNCPRRGNNHKNKFCHTTLGTSIALSVCFFLLNLHLQGIVQAHSHNPNCLYYLDPSLSVAGLVLVPVLLLAGGWLVGSSSTSTLTVCGCEYSAKKCALLPGLVLQVIVLCNLVYGVFACQE